MEITFDEPMTLDRFYIIQRSVSVSSPIRASVIFTDGSSEVIQDGGFTETTTSEIWMEDISKVRFDVIGELETGDYVYVLEVLFHGCRTRN